MLDESRRAWEAAARAGAEQQRARSAVARHRAGSRAPLLEASAEALRAAAQEERQRLGRLEALRSVVEQAEFDEEAADGGPAGPWRWMRGWRYPPRQASPGCARPGQRRWPRGTPPARPPPSRAARRPPPTLAAAWPPTSRPWSAERASRQELQEAHLTAREQAVTLKEEAQRLRDQRFDNMRFELAALLADDDECPVCGSLDHPSPCELAGERVSREQEEAAAGQADAAAARADEVGRRVAATDAVIAILAGRLAAAGVDVLEDMTALSAAAEHAQADASRMAAHAQRLAEVAAGLCRRATGDRGAGRRHRGG